MMLSELKSEQKFRLPDWPKAGTLTYLGPDGMYGKVRADDPVMNKEMCARYDANADFFCIAIWTEVELQEAA